MHEVNPDQTTTTATLHRGPGESRVTAFQDDLHYSQALRVGDRVEISGQGGWDADLAFPDDLEAEIVRAFDNVGAVLAQAGATWADVVAVDSFHVPTEPDQIGTEPTRVMSEQFRARMGDTRPIWTQIGVAALGAVGMRVEIKVTAVLSRAGS